MKNFIKNVYFKSLLFTVVFVTIAVTFAENNQGGVHPW